MDMYNSMYRLQQIYIGKQKAKKKNYNDDIQNIWTLIKNQRYMNPESKLSTHAVDALLH